MANKVIQYMKAKMAGDRIDLAECLFGPSGQTCTFYVTWVDGGEVTLDVRITGFTREQDSLHPYHMTGVVECLDGRDWESLDAFFDMHCNWFLEGNCTVGPFPEGEA